MRKHMWRPAVTWIAFVGTLTACAADQATLQKRLEPHYRTYRPDGSGPFPAIMLVPGGTGFQPARVSALYGPMADRLKAQGYLVIFVDWHSARGLPLGVIASTPREEIAQDILASAAYLRSLPFVKRTEIGAIGWSWGGGAVLAALAGMRDEEPKPFHAAAIFYPTCQELRPWKAKVPVFMLLGELDDVALPATCQRLARQLSQGNPVETRMYAGARHAFDVSDLPAVAPFPSGAAGERRTIGHNPQAAREAWEDVFRFFRRSFAPT